MSWLPANDPILGDKQACDAIELVIVPRARDLGGLRGAAGPAHGQRQMVGPFIFFDQFGPAEFLARPGHGRAPAPAYRARNGHLPLRRRILHRDSLGTFRAIRPAPQPDDRRARHRPFGAHRPGRARAAGRSCRHPELGRPAAHARGRATPAFLHYAAGPLPIVEDSGVTRAAHRRAGARPTSPVEHAMAMILRRVEARAGASCRSTRSRGARRSTRSSRRDRDRRRPFRARATARFPARRPHYRPAASRARVMLLGGDADGRTTLHLVELRLIAARSGSSRPRPTGGPARFDTRAGRDRVHPAPGAGVRRWPPTRELAGLRPIYPVNDESRSSGARL